MGKITITKPGAESTNNEVVVGTRLRFDIRPEIMSILKRPGLASSRSGPAIHRGQSNGVLLTTAWLLYLVSPELSGNYYVFARAGDFPRRSEAEDYSRKTLRDRIEWAEGTAIHSLHPELKFKLEDRALTGGDWTKPANASQDSEIREWDIPIIARGDKMLVPTNWTGLTQIRGQETYHLNSNFAVTQVPGLLILGRILRNVLCENEEVKKLLKSSPQIWGRLKEVLEKQHDTTRRAYMDRVESIDKSRAILTEETEGALLAFSIIDFRPRSVLKHHHRLRSRDLKRQEMRKFT